MSTFPLESNFGHTVLIMPVPELLPHQSPELWKRTVRSVIERMTTLQVIIVSAFGIVVSGAVDHILDIATGFDFIQPALYMLPVGFAAWAAGTRIGIVAAICSMIVAHQLSQGLHAQFSERLILFLFGLQTLAMITGAYLMARLRYTIEEERSMAREDHLTGVSNSRSFWEDLDVELQRMTRDDRPLTVLFIDVDNFKTVNDQLGHKTGDGVLKCIGQSMKDLTRAVDIVARIGGDEFAMLLPGADVEAGILVAERLRTTFRERCLVNDIVSLSIGVATFKSPPDKAESLLHAADRLMYEAKSTGKNRIAVRVY